MTIDTTSIWRFSHGLTKSVCRRNPWLWITAIHEVLHILKRSLWIVILSSVFVGAILVLLFAFQLSRFGALSLLGPYTCSALIRQVAPVLVAFLISGQCGAYAASEISTMRVTDQLDTLQTLGLCEIDVIIAPRLIAIFLASTLLLLVSQAGGVLGAGLFAQFFQNTPLSVFFAKFSWILGWDTLCVGGYKCLVFGAAIAFLSCLSGFQAQRLPDGVSHAVQTAAKRNMFAIIALDSLTTWSFSGLLKIFERLP